MKIKPVRTPEDLVAAKETLAGLILKNVETKNDDDIEVLSTLIEQFERSHSPIDPATPISAIKFRMDELGITPRQLEPFIGSRARISEVLSGKRSLSIDMIRSLHEGLAIPYESLMSERTKASGSDDATIAKLRSLGFDQQNISSFVHWTLRDNSPIALHRKTRTQRAASKTDQRALVLWQATVLKKSMLQRSCKFDPSKMTATELRQIAILSSKPNGPVRALRSLSDRGISVVILPSLSGMFLDGAVMLGPTGNPVIGLTLRHDRIDSFWFTLLHECAHVALHYQEMQGDNSGFVDDMEISSEEVHEREADDLARISLIPDSILSQVCWNEATSQDDLQAIATRARVHISVVAGRWQRDHQNYKKFARLIERDTVRALLAEK